jgi:predicted ATPase/DNA-binding SARP family transcriptional activator/Flp pilus assembly protein TadD
MTQLTISLLGPFQVTLDDSPITDFATDKARALLAYLAVEVDRPHRREALAGLLWPDQPQRKANQNLRQALLYLRQSLGDCEAEPRLLVSRETIQFNAHCDHWLDVAAFAALSQACQAHRHTRLTSCVLCLRRMEQMAELYQGEFLSQFFVSDSSAFEEWALLKREWLRHQAVQALSCLADFCERRGELERARQYARRQVELEPWREEAHRQVMRLLALDGQRSAALAQYETCRRALAQELGIEPTDETVALYERILAGQVLRAASPPHNLPTGPTPFVGREAELAELAELIANPDCRLVTLVGPGGIGKSRLALQMAADQVGAFAHGVYFVPLAAVSSPELIVSALADAIEFTFHDHQDPKEQLLNYLHDSKREMLLVLDNVEHLLPRSASSASKGESVVELLAELLKRAPGVVLLATSRERSALQEEWVYEVAGLTYPTSLHTPSLLGEGPGERWETYSAIALFQQRASQAQRRFSLSEEAPHVARICQLVEGMPLGVELAAAWVSVHSCETIAQELEGDLDILTTSLRNVPARQRSVRATFEHSWRLLSEVERDAFIRLSVFRGGFRLEAAVQVAGASASTLSALLDKSLLRRVAPDRYDMHDLLRQYAAEKLEAKPQALQETQMQHTRHFAAFLERQVERLKGKQQRQALLDMVVEVENARQAWLQAVTHGCVREIDQSLESLYHFYEAQGRFREGIDLFARAIERWQGDVQQERLVGQVISRQGALYRYQGLYPQARTALEQGRAISERLGIPSEQIFCLVSLADVARKQSGRDETEQLAQKSLALSKQTQNDWGTTTSLFLLGAICYEAGDIEEARTLLEESLAVARASDNRRLVLSPLNSLGDIACHYGDFARAQRLFEECLALSRELGDPFNVAVHLNNLGTVLHILGQYAEARSLYQESLDICRKISDQSGQAVALSNLGEIAFVFGAYPDAQQYYQEGLLIGRTTQDQWTIMICLNNLGEIACTRGDFQHARTYLAEVMRIATETRALTILMKVLVNLAVLFAKEGQSGRAATLLGLALRHPASEQDIRKKAERLLAEMALIAPENVEPLDVMVAELSAEMFPAGL